MANGLSRRRKKFNLKAVRRIEQLVEHRPTPKERSKWKKEDIERVSRLLTPEVAQDRLEEVVKRPDLDRGRVAKEVAQGPGEADTAPELNQQLRWFRNPRRMDLEGVDAPQGAATPPPAPRPRQKRPKVAPPEQMKLPEFLAEESLPEVREEDRPEELGRLEPSPLARGKDYILTAEDLQDTTSPARRFDLNLEAIQLVKQLEEEDRLATPEEQAILAKYSGFGDSAFNPAFSRFSRDEAWQRRGERLRELTTDEEYQAIERSRLNAFYTTPEVIQFMWDAVGQMDARRLTRPRVLEPSAGSGRFLGLQPVDMAQKSQRTAVELDDLTGKMLKQLYPNAEVHAGVGYQDAPIPNDSIDIAVSNVPFGDFPVTDPEFGKGRRFLTRQIHNYFFAKTLDKLRPGGVMAFITTHSTLDSERAKPIREALAEQADLVGAIRLPKGAFPDTEVVTDIVFMRKRKPGEVPGDKRWVDTGEITTQAGEGNFKFDVEHSVNQYFIDNPEQVLGEHSATGSLYRRDEYSVEPTPGQDLNVALQNALERLPKDIIEPPLDQPGERERSAPTLTAINAKEGAYVVNEGGKLMRKQGRQLVETELNPADSDKIRSMLSVRDAARVVLDKQLHEASEEEIKEAQRALNAHYDAFVKEHGPLNSKANAQLMRLDPDGAFLRALERQEGKEWVKMPIFNQRVIKGLGDFTASTPLDAMAVTLNETGGLDFDRMGQLLGQEPEEVRKALADQGAIYKNPVGGWETADEYLTGDVRGKLRTAEVAARANPLFKANVDALKEVQPEDLTPSQIDVQLGSPWVPPDDVNGFIRHLLDAFSFRSRGRGRFGQFYNYIPQTGIWVEEQKIDGNRAKMFSQWGTERMGADEIIDRLLNSKPIEVFDRLPDDTRVRNASETIAAQEKAQAIQEEFKRWIWDDPERAERLGRLYNDTFNNLRPRVFNGEHQTLPGMDPVWAEQLHDHQKDAIWRVVQDGSTLMAHEVGFGKTAAMVGAGMELRRLGLSRKNLYVVPKATHAQFRKQFQEIYPYAKVLFPEQGDFSPDKRPEMMSRIATGDWDAVIISDTQFRRIPVKPETEEKLLRAEISDLRAAMEAEAEGEGGRGSKTHKELQKAMVRLEERLKATQARAREVTDDAIFFEDLGVDQMFVDEADMFKNLRFSTRMGRIKGLPNTDSQRAWDMFQKVRHLQEKGNGRGVVFATGTPIANTVAEGYTMMRYLQQPMLEERGLQHFDAWAKTFGGTTEGLEQTPTGQYRLTQRFAKFNNVPELSNLWQTTADIRVAAEVPELTKLQPKILNEKGEEGRRTVVTADASSELRSYMQELARRADNLSNVDPTEDNMLKISNDARLASLDMRLVDPSAEFDKEGKVAKAIGNISEIYKDTDKDKGTQLVFLDMGTPKAVDKPFEDGLPEDQDFQTGAEQKLLKNVYEDMRNRLVAAGIPREEIAFIHDADTNEKRNRLFANVNSGKVRVLIGSTGKMGAGVNVQERAAALHHLDAPWRPRDIEQREGRIVRQGNMVYGPKIDPNTGEVLDKGKGVQIYNYVTEGSFDAYMWQAIEAKAKAIRSLLRRNVTARSIEDVDSLAMSAGEAKALASGNPDVMKSVQLKNDINRLQLVESSHRDSIIRARRELQALPKMIESQETALAKLQKDKALAEKTKGKDFLITLGRQTFSKRPEAGERIVEVVSKIPMDGVQSLGFYRDFSVLASRSPEGVRFILHNPATEMEHQSNPVQELTATGSVQRIENAIGSIEDKIERAERNIKQNKSALETFKEQAQKPFEQQDRLNRLRKELAEVEKRLQGQPEEEPAQELEVTASQERELASVGTPAGTGLMSR